MVSPKCLDISLNENDAEQAKQLVIEHVHPEWRSLAVESKAFTEGISNKLYGFYVGELNANTVLVRIYGSNTELIVDRDAEMRNMTLLHERGCAPAVYFRFRNGVSYGFVPGCVADPVSIRQPQVYRLVAAQMADLHCTPLTEPAGRHVFDRIDRWIRLSPDSFDQPDRQRRFVDTIPAKKRLFDEVRWLAAIIEPLRRPVVFAHNDILLCNIVVSPDKQRVAFIDLEYAAANYDLFDVANHFNEWAGLQPCDYSLYPPKQTQMDFLGVYAERRRHSGLPLDDDIECLQAQVSIFALLSHLYWGVWALIQARYSTIDFDFLGYAAIRINRYLETKDQVVPQTTLTDRV